MTLTGAGSYTSPGTIIAPESGFYTWVWSIDKDTHGANAKYLTDSFIDRYGQVTETSVVPFQPAAVSEADQRLAVPGGCIDGHDQGVQLERCLVEEGRRVHPGDLRGHRLPSPRHLPPTQNAVIDAAAVPLGTVTVTTDGPGVYTSPSVVAPRWSVTWCRRRSRRSRNGCATTSPTTGRTTTASTRRQPPSGGRSPRPR